MLQPLLLGQFPGIKCFPPVRVIKTAATNPYIRHTLIVSLFGSNTIAVNSPFKNCNKEQNDAVIYFILIYVQSMYPEILKVIVIHGKATKPSRFPVPKFQTSGSFLNEVGCETRSQIYFHFLNFKHYGKKLLVQDSERLIVS